jgi:capsular exopolysaccharide synthesis family protein
MSRTALKSKDRVRPSPVVRPGAGPLTELVISSDPYGGRAEAVRSLQTHIMAQHVALGRRALAVCAPTIDSGCTFIAANLAVAFSQVGLKTLLIDGDMRGVGIETVIAPRDSGIGLRQYLTSPDPDLVANIESNVLPNLSLLHSGGPVNNALELLGDDRFETLIAACMRDFDLTIIDTPPANVGADALRIGAVAGYGLVVARRNRTFVNDIKTLQAEMAADGMRLIGSVLVEA